MIESTTRTIDRNMPSNDEAEQAVLGSLLLDPDAITRIASFLKQADFYLEKHGWIYEAILGLHEEREPIDLLTVTSHLETHGKLSSVGGTAYLAMLVNAVPTAIHVEHYAHLVETASVQRQLIQASTEITGFAYAGTESLDVMLQQAEQKIFEVAERRQTHEMVPMRRAVDRWIDRIDYLREHPGEMLGVQTGFVDLDKLLGGLQKSDLVIIAGRPGSGKTSFALSICFNAAIQKHRRVAIFSLEMSAQQLVERLLAQVADQVASELTGDPATFRVDSQSLHQGIIDDEQMHVLARSTGILSDAEIYIDESSLVTPLDIRSKARRLKAEKGGLDLIIIDYMQLMTDRGRAENRVQEMSSISRQMKFLAREMEVPVLALSQLSRAVEARTDKRPQLADLRESGSIEQDADLVVFIYREKNYFPTLESWQRVHSNKEYPENIAEIILAKHRHGPVGEIKMFFDEKRAKFKDLARMPE